MPGAGLAGVEHDDARAALRGAPRARRGRSRRRRRRRRRSSLTALPLRLRPPYAGTTRIRFDGRRPGGALSARLRAPVFCVHGIPWCDDATRAPRHRPPVPRLPRAAAGLARGRGARRRRPDPAARQGRSTTTGSSRRRARSTATDALFILNDRPDLVEACGADGVHVGQDDATPAQARARGRAGPDRRPLDARARAGARPPRPTPTSTTSPSAPCTRRRPSRAARPPACDYVAHAASTVGKPWFAIGGLDAGNVHEVVERGATRIVVVRAITEAEDPEAAARALRAALEGRVGAVTPRTAHRAAATLARGYARSRRARRGDPRRAGAARARRAPARPQARASALALFIARREPDRRGRRRGRRSRPPSALAFAALMLAARGRACGRAATSSMLALPGAAGRSRSSTPRSRCVRVATCSALLLALAVIVDLLRRSSGCSSA